MLAGKEGRLLAEDAEKEADTGTGEEAGEEKAAGPVKLKGPV
jgi:hypothetical protein